MGTFCTSTSVFTLMVGYQNNTASSALVDKCIARAEAEIKKYLSKRYDITAATFQTVGSIPPLVTELCEQMAGGYAYRWASRGGKESITRGKELIKDAVDNLKMISEYKLDLLDSTGSVITDMSNTAYRVLSNTDEYHTTFNEDDPINWDIDSDKIDDIADERD